MVQDHLGNQYNTQRDMCKNYNINETTFANRKRNGWSIERALSEPVTTIRRGTSLREYCKKSGLSEILNQFDEKMNYPETVDTVTAKSDKKMFFYYNQCGHSKAQRVADKTSKRSVKCPICQNRGAVGRSLTLEFPDSFAKMFDVAKNGISPEEVSFRNGAIYWWNCLSCGQSFSGRVAEVTSERKICPFCANKKRSDAEKILAFYTYKVDKGRILNFVLDGWKFDIYLPKYNLLIEYDGYPWHDTEVAMNNDTVKDEIAIKHNYRICRLRDSRLKQNKGIKADVWLFEYDYSYDYFMNLPMFLVKYIGNIAFEMKINVRQDKSKIHNFNLKECKSESLLSLKPEIVTYIDYNDKRNGDISYILTKTHKIRLYMRHPKYEKLKWSYTVHALTDKKNTLVPRSIKMCEKIIDRYPDLLDTVCSIGVHMHENTIISKKCDICGTPMEYKYTQLYYTKITHKMCKACLRNYRLENIKKSHVKV